jgi:two-component system OmpR family sensor kinase
MSKSSNGSSGQNFSDARTVGGNAPMRAKAPAPDARDLLIAELREAIRRRDDFLAVAAHELRNPMTPILLCLELIRSAEAAGNQALTTSGLNRLQRLIRHFVARANTLLEVSQVASNKLQLDCTKQNLSELVESIVEDHKPLVDRSGSDLITNIQRGVVAYVDQLAVSQIVENLLSNAIKYGRRKPIALTLTSTLDLAQIIVQDGGIGINEIDKQRIFERFERAVGREVQPGFGIGLWLTRNLAQRMGGSISVVGEPGVGSTFTVTLPIRPQGSHE